jgi:hypothetical protein
VNDDEGERLRHGRKYSAGEAGDRSGLQPSGPWGPGTWGDAPG